MDIRKEDLVGAWREVGREFISRDGTTRRDVPRTSQIMYTPDGYMGVVNTTAQRPVIGDTAGRMDLDAVSAADRAAAALGVVAYAGHYEIKGGCVHHTLYTALNPALVGTTQLRVAALDGDDLTLATLPDTDGNSFRIHWRRAGRM